MSAMQVVAIIAAAFGIPGAVMVLGVLALETIAAAPRRRT